MRGSGVGRTDGPVTSPMSSIVGMGYSDDVARTAAWQFLKAKDPLIGMPRRFAAAADLPVEELVGGPKGKRKK